MCVKKSFETISESVDCPDCSGAGEYPRFSGNICNYCDGTGEAYACRDCGEIAGPVQIKTERQLTFAGVTFTATIYSEQCRHCFSTVIIPD